MIEGYNIQVDCEQIPEVRKHCLAKLMAKGWSSQERLDAGLPPDIVSCDAESFELTDAQIEHLQKRQIN